MGGIRRARRGKPGGKAPQLKPFLRYLAIVVLFIVVVGPVLLFTPLGKRPLTALFPVGAVETVDFAALTLTDKPNQLLMCPPEFCSAKLNIEGDINEALADQISNLAWELEHGLEASVYVGRRSNRTA